MTAAVQIDHRPDGAVLIRDASGRILGGAGLGGGAGWSWWSRATSGHRVFVADREAAIAALAANVGATL